MKNHLLRIALFSLFILTSATIMKAQVAPAASTPVVFPNSHITFEIIPLIMAPSISYQLEGTYDAKVMSRGQEAVPLTLTITRVGEKLTAESNGSQDITITGIKVDGENVTLSAAFQGNPFDLVGRVHDGSMTGTWHGGAYEGTWSASRHVDK